MFLSVALCVLQNAFFLLSQHNISVINFQFIISYATLKMFVCVCVQ